MNTTYVVTDKELIEAAESLLKSPPPDDELTTENYTDEDGRCDAVTFVLDLCGVTMPSTTVFSEWNDTPLLEMRDYPKCDVVECDTFSPDGWAALDNLESEFVDSNPTRGELVRCLQLFVHDLTPE